MARRSSGGSRSARAATLDPAAPAELRRDRILGRRRRSRASLSCTVRHPATISNREAGRKGRGIGLRIGSDDARLLGELGLLAAGRGLAREAELIASGLSACRPSSAIAGIVRGVAAMSRQDAEGAVRVLRDEALRAEPDSLEARALLGLALEQAGFRSAAETVLAPLVDADSEGAGDLAKAGLDARRGQPEQER